jgi:hypothetical protein
MPKESAARSVKEIAMDEADDQRQFFADLAATARQGVEGVRGIEENYYAAVHSAVLPLPWLTNISDKLQSYVEQSYVEQHFKNGFDYALELRQARDFREFTLINSRWVEKFVASLLAQAEDFAEPYTLPVMREKATASPSIASS